MVYRLKQATKLMSVQVFIVIVLFSGLIALLGSLLIGVSVSLDVHSFNPHLADTEIDPNNFNKPDDIVFNNQTLICNDFGSVECKFQTLSGALIGTQVPSELVNFNEQIQNDIIIGVQNESSQNIRIMVGVLINNGTDIIECANFEVGSFIKGQKSVYCNNLQLTNARAFTNRSGGLFSAYHSLIENNTNNVICESFFLNCDYQKNETTFQGNQSINLYFNEITNETKTAYQLLIKPQSFPASVLDIQNDLICFIYGPDNVTRCDNQNLDPLSDEGSQIFDRRFVFENTSNSDFTILEVKLKTFQRVLIHSNQEFQIEIPQIGDTNSFNISSSSLPTSQPSCSISYDALTTTGNSIVCLGRPGFQLYEFIDTKLSLGVDINDISAVLDLTISDLFGSNLELNKSAIYVVREADYTLIYMGILLVGDESIPVQEVILKFISNPFGISSGYLLAVELAGFGIILFTLNLIVAFIVVKLGIWNRIGGRFSPFLALRMRGFTGKLLGYTQFFNFKGDWYIESGGVTEYSFKSYIGVFHELIIERWRDIIFFPTVVTATLGFIIISIIGNPNAFFLIFVIAPFMPILLAIWTPFIWVIEDSGLKKAVTGKTGQITIVQQITDILRDGADKLIGISAFIFLGTTGAGLIRSEIRGGADFQDDILVFLLSSIGWAITLFIIVASLSMAGMFLTSYFYLNTKHIENVNAARVKLTSKKIDLATTNKNKT